jgi:Mn-containing catalase
MMGKFEDNGGYYIDGVPYMDCKITGDPVKNVSTDAKEVIGDRALMSRMYKMFPEEMEAKTKSYKPTGRPAGWHWMAEFVDKDGNVFHKGVEQPKLKGTLPPTKVKKPKKKMKRRTKDEILVAKYNEKKKILKKELQKQKDFLNHKI